MKLYNVYVKVNDSWSFLSSEVHATSEESAILRFDTLNYQIKAVECFPYEVYVKDNFSSEDYYVDSVWAENESAANLLARKNYNLKSNIEIFVRRVNRD